MKKNRIRFMCLLLAVVMALGLAACGKAEEPSDPNHIVIGDYELQYKSACIMKDSDGKDAVVLTMDFTNNGEEPADYMWSVYEKVMQDGVELEGAIIFESEESYKTVTDSQMTEIASGKTIEVCSAYTLRDMENPVEVTFTDLLETYKGKITVNPSELGQGSAAGTEEESPAL